MKKKKQKAQLTPMVAFRKALKDDKWGEAMKMAFSLFNKAEKNKVLYALGEKLLSIAGDNNKLKTAFYFMDLYSVQGPKEGKFIWLLNIATSYYDSKKYPKLLLLTKTILDIMNKLPEEQRPKRNLQTDMWKLYALALHSLGFIEDAVNAFNETWQKNDNKDARYRDFGNVLLAAQCTNFADEDLFAMHCSYNSLFKDIEPYQYDMAAYKSELQQRIADGGKIKIGYISPDFHDHPVLNFCCGLFRFYDRSRFEVHCYSTQAKQDYVTEWVKEQTDDYVDVSDLTFEQTAQKIHDDHIDILIDLAGHTGNTGLPALAYKPAPIQMSGIGYLSSTGLKAVDYIITDKIIDPPENNGQYLTEKPFYLTSHFCYQYFKGEMPASMGAPCLKNGYVTFGSFNKYQKFTNEMLGAWKRIMDEVPNSRLFLKGMTCEDPDFMQMLKERFSSLGFDLSRVDVEGYDGKYMERYLDVDIALDTYPYTGGTTTCDAIYMGVPVVSRYGNRRNTRFSLGILQTMGLKSLTADNVEDYVTYAVGLAQNTELLDSLHKKLRQMFLKSPMGTPEAYTRETEKKFLEILGLNV